MYVPYIITLSAGDGRRQPRQTSFLEFHILAPTFVTVTQKFVRIGHHCCAELIKHRFASLQSKKLWLNSKNCSYNQRIAILCFLIVFCDGHITELYCFKERLTQNFNAYGSCHNQFPSSVSRYHSSTLKIAQAKPQIYRQLWDANSSAAQTRGRSA